MIAFFVSYAPQLWPSRCPLECLSTVGSLQFLIGAPCTIGVSCLRFPWPQQKRPSAGEHGPIHHRRCCFARNLSDLHPRHQNRRTHDPRSKFQYRERCYCPAKKFF